MAEVKRKRRKWDVAAPQGIPITDDGPQPPAAANGAAGAARPAASAAPAPAQPTFQQTPPAMVIKPAKPLTSDVIAKAQQGAAAILAKINQELAAQGKLRPGTPGSVGEDKEIAQEVTINNAPAEIRHHLTKRSTQDDIARRTGTTIVVRGRYMPPGLPPDEKEKPLLLRITPGRSATEDDAEKTRSVAVAAGLVTEILNGVKLPRSTLPYQPPAERPATVSVSPAASGLPSSLYMAETPPIGESFGTGFGQPGSVPGPPPVRPGPAVPMPPASTSAPAPPSTGGGGRATKLWVNIQASPAFNLTERLRGPGDAYIAHIAKESRAAVALRGLDSGVPGESEPLHISIVAPDPKSFEVACRLAQNLIDTLRADHAKQYPIQPQAPPPQASAPTNPSLAAPIPQDMSSPQPTSYQLSYPLPSAPYPNSPITLPPPGVGPMGPVSHNAPYMPMAGVGPGSMAQGPMQMPTYAGYAGAPPFQAPPPAYPYNARPPMHGIPQPRPPMHGIPQPGPQYAPPQAAHGGPLAGHAGARPRPMTVIDKGPSSGYNAVPPPVSLLETAHTDPQQAQALGAPPPYPMHPMPASVGPGPSPPAPAVPAYMQKYAAPPGTYRPPPVPGAAAAHAGMGQSPVQGPQQGMPPPRMDLQTVVPCPYAQPMHEWVQQAGRMSPAQAAAEVQEQQRRKRFRESREAELQAATHHTPQRASYTEAYAGASSMHGIPGSAQAPNSVAGQMGPPVRPTQGRMGPPPPRFLQANGTAGGMGPPPPRQPLRSAGGQGSDATNPLGALVDYGEDD